MAPDFAEIGYSGADSVATITLQRPQRLNAFTQSMAQEIVAACDLAESDDDVRAVVFTGSGRAFCAGADVDPAAGEFTRVGIDMFDDGVARDVGGSYRCGSPACSNPQSLQSTAPRSALV